MQNPYIQETTEQTSEFLRLALALLSKHKIPPSPVNYQLAYEYVSGKNKALIETLDEHMSHADGISQEALWDIYQRFFVQDIAALEKMRKELRFLIANMQNEFERSGGELTGFSSRLNEFASVLDTDKNPQEISSEVQKMISGTQSVAKSQKKFDTQMSDIMEEVETLRKEIEQIKEESLTDALTGIANRRAFDDALSKFMHSSTEENTPLSLLLIDIDHFKKFNDTFGHLVGDKVLRFMGTTLRRCVKGQDFTARFGGEEFSVILPHTNKDGAKVIAELIRRAISSTELHDKDNHYGKITASIGVTEYSQGEDVSELIQRCDTGLYQAKADGRNRVVLA